MYTLFLVCAAVGGAIVLLQLTLGLLGVGHDLPDLDHGAEGADALNLLSVRSLAAGVAFFGIGGLAALAGGIAPLLALLLALLVGGGAAVGVAALMRSLVRLEDDGTVRLDRSLGQPGTVYLSIPGQRAGAGKVLLTLQNRTVECQAVTALDELPTGTPVVVVDILGPDTVEVAPTPTLGGFLDGPS